MADSTRKSTTNNTESSSKKKKKFSTRLALFGIFLAAVAYSKFGENYTRYFVEQYNQKAIGELHVAVKGIWEFRQKEKKEPEKVKDLLKYISMLPGITYPSLSTGITNVSLQPNTFEQMSDFKVISFIHKYGEYGSKTDTYTWSEHKKGFFRHTQSGVAVTPSFKERMKLINKKDSSLYYWVIATWVILASLVIFTKRSFSIPFSLALLAMLHLL